MSAAKYKVVITGASGGIGREIVKLLAPKSLYIILVGLYEAELTALKDELTLSNAYIVHGNINDADTRNKIKTLAESLDGVNLVINNAGINDFNLYENQTEETIQKIVEINLLAPMLLSRSLLPLLKKERKAEIINTGSILGYIGYPGNVAYCVSKFGLRGFSQSLKRELGDTNVNVRYFAPRTTQTKINHDDVVSMNKALGNAVDSPEEVARHFMKFLTRSKGEKKLGFKESFFVFMNNLFPEIPGKAITKQLPIIKKYLPK